MSATTTPRTGKPLAGAHNETIEASALRTLALVLLAVCVADVVTIILGPLVLGIIDYPVGESVLSQQLGLEVVTLGIVVPWSAVAAIRCLRLDVTGPVWAIGPSAYVAYMESQYVVGPEYGEYRAVALVHVGLFATALGVAIWSFALGCRAGLAPFSPAAGRRWGGVLFALAAVVALRYTSAVVGGFTREPIPAEFAEARAFYWTIVLLDLGVVVPATLLVALSAWRRWAHGAVAVAAVLGWFALVPPSVAAMATVMWARGDASASGAHTAVLWVIAGVSAGVAVGGLHQVVRRQESAR